VGTCLEVKGAPDVAEIRSFRDCRPAKQVEVSLQAGAVRVQQGGTRQRCRPYQSEQQRGVQHVYRDDFFSPAMQIDLIRPRRPEPALRSPPPPPYLVSFSSVYPNTED
jgi:hypothetical protein